MPAGKGTEHATDTSTNDTNMAVLLDVYSRLYARYGPQHWWPGNSQLEVVLGAILTQSAAWTNVEKALANLRAAEALSVEALRRIDERELATLLRPSGYFNAKARKVKAFIDHLWDNYAGDLQSFLSKDIVELREELLSLYGIGEETADDIVLYAADKPSFVIDNYTRRILGRLRFSPESHTYQAYQQLFHQNLPADPAMYNEYHALLDRHAKLTCKKEPQCKECCLLELCPTGKGSIDRPNVGNL